MRTRSTALLLVVPLVLAGSAFGLIDPRFTPVHLVQQSRAVWVASILPAANPDVWKLSVSEALKGARPARCTLNLGAAKPDQLEALRKLLAGNGAAPVLLFWAENDATRKAWLSVNGMWLEADSVDGVRWDLVAFAPKLSGTWAGGTDMLIRVCRYVLAEASADVPSSIGLRWMESTASLGTIPGTVAGMQAVELPGDTRRYLFVGSDRGDRLYRARVNDEAFDDVTAPMELDTRSVRFAWTDVTGDGRVDLVSCDGAIIHVRELAPDGTFAAPRAALDFKLDEGCLGLAPCALSPDGAPALLVSTRTLPFILSRKDGAWVKTALSASAPGVKVEAEAPCVVADLDNDGLFDVLEMVRGKALLWKGSPEGFRGPVESAVVAPRGPCHVALGDFNQDGFLDLFAAGADSAELWENDGRAGLGAVTSQAGSLSYKMGPGVSDCLAADLNHDGRPDLCLLYAEGEFACHFNRGFRCFGQEGELRLPADEDAPKAAAGQRACAIADFNGDDSLDLAVLFTDGRVRCFYNGAFGRPMLRVRLKNGLAAPVTVSVWQGRKFPLCLGAQPVGPTPLSTIFTLRESAKCTVRWPRPGRPDRHRELVIPDEHRDGPVEFTVGD